MDDFDSALVSVRADTQGFRSDVEEMRRMLSDGLGGVADIAGRRIESALLRAIRTGKIGFEDLKRTALAVMSDIANAAIRSGLGSILGGGAGHGGLVNLGSSVLGAVLGIPGRSTGGPVAPGRAYRVGERGPELFVPTASGRVEAAGSSTRDVRVTIHLNAPGAPEPEALARSSRQIAREVRRALERAE